MIVAAAEVAVAAAGVLVDALDGGRFFDAGSGAFAALDTFSRIDLPERPGWPLAFAEQVEDGQRQDCAEQLSYKAS